MKKQETRNYPGQCQITLVHVPVGHRTGKIFTKSYWGCCSPFFSQWIFSVECQQEALKYKLHQS